MKYRTLRRLKALRVESARRLKFLRTMNWVIIILCLIIVFAGLAGCTFNG